MKRQPIDRAIRNTLARRDGRATDNCPDDSLIAAYLESRLQPEECTRFEAHAAVCESCREVLALSLQLSEADELPETVPDRHGKRIFYFAIPVSVVAVILVASFAGLLYYRGIYRAAKESETATTAELRAPVEEKHDRSGPPPASAPGPAPTYRLEKQTWEPAPPAGGSNSVALDVPAKPAQSPHEMPAPDKAREVAQLDESDAGAPPALETDALKSKSEVSKEIAGRPSPAVVGTVGGVAAPGNLPQETELPARRAGTVETAALESKDLQYQKAVPSGELKGTEAGLERRGRKKASADRPSSAHEKTVGGRTFTKAAGVWVDAECRKHPSAEQVPLKRDSSEFDEIRLGIPGIEDLVTDTVRVQVFWKGRIYIIGP